MEAEGEFRFSRPFNNPWKYPPTLREFYEEVKRFRRRTR